MIKKEVTANNTIRKIGWWSRNKDGEQVDAEKRLRPGEDARLCSLGCDFKYTKSKPSWHLHPKNQNRTSGGLG